MGTKERLFKLIFLFAICIVFIWLLSMGNNVYGAKITGQVVDENNSPIEGIEVNYGGNTSPTSSNGLYSVDGTGTEITYNFTNGKKYDEVLEAVSITYEPEKENKEYNIVIVRPESGYEAEFQELEQMISNCKIKKGKEIITYNDTTFKYKGNDISNPHQKYCEDMYDNTCINLFIVIGTENMPDLGGVTAGGGELWRRNIYYNTTSTQKNVRNMQEIYDFNAVKQLIKEYGNIKENAEEDLLPVEELVEDSHARIKLKTEKSQTVRIKLKEKIDSTPPEYIGNYIEGYVYTLDGTKELKKIDGKPITDKEGNQIYGSFIKGVGVKLYKEDGVTEVEDGDGNIIEEVRTDENGHYSFENVPGAALNPDTLEIIPKDYMVKFTYGDQEHFQIAQSVKYNGNDYESTEAVYETIEEEVVTYLETEELVEEPVIEETITEEPTKLDIYLVLDCSGSMGGSEALNHLIGYSDENLPIGYARKGALNFVNDVYDKYRK